jgi:hypothetical protein
VTLGAVPGNGATQKLDGPLCGGLALGNAGRGDLPAEGVEDGADVEGDGTEEPGQGREIGDPHVVRRARPDALQDLAHGLDEAQGPSRRRAAELALNRGAGGLETEADEDGGDAPRDPRRVLPAEEGGGLADEVAAVLRRRRDEQPGQARAGGAEPGRERRRRDEKNSRGAVERWPVQRAMAEDAEPVERLEARAVSGLEAAEPGDE